MMVSVVNVETAFTILNKRQQRGTDCVVNVIGKVICVSEVVRIKENHLFMVKLAHNVDLIIKRKECLHWQKELSPYSEYILTNLRPTIIQKGSRSPHRVFTVTRNSQLYLPDNVNMVLMTESDIVKQYGIQHDDHLTHTDIHDPAIDGIFSYQGKVTATLDPGLGVFELDKTVRLFVGPVPAVHKYSMLREGATVLVQNAHYTTSKQYPRVTLYCCMLTKVQCVEESNETKQQTNGVKLNEEMKKLLYLHGQSQKQLDHMFTLRNVLKKQFLNILGDRLTESIFTKVVTNIWFNVGDQINKRAQRMLIDEFLNTPHKCPLIGGDTVIDEFLNTPHKCPLIGGDTVIDEFLNTPHKCPLIGGDTVIDEFLNTPHKCPLIGGDTVIDKFLNTPHKCPLIGGDTPHICHTCDK
ncbi:uncharacterized protein LOC132748892 [Ruditapes philippinarum]|uniref:uncharacterized protein LOC132748892 n=1 Tax=Ruditapes philippinarum TaxID=129788 RepID=UPI00295B41EA|nr:uncharacterized protein LOC132748892 [Ruditapes philippinarum]